MGAQVSTPRSRSIGWVPIGAGLVIVIALVWIWATDTTADLDPNSVQGVVQRYAAAVIDRDERAASELLTERAQVCEDAPHRVPVPNMSISLISADDAGDRAEVRVSITQTGQGGPFGPDEWRSEGIFELDRTPDGWRIGRVPWELQVCEPSNSEVAP